MALTDSSSSRCAPATEVVTRTRLPRQTTGSRTSGCRRDAVVIEVGADELRIRAFLLVLGVVL